MLVRETQVCTRQAEAVLAMSEPRCSLGTAEAGRSLAAPYHFADAEPLAWKRVEESFHFARGSNTLGARAWSVVERVCVPDSEK